MQNYQNIKEELYNFDDNDQQKFLDDTVKQEDDHVENPYINWSLMKLIKLDEQLIDYMENKYYRNSLSGLIGKIFDMDESKIDPDRLPG